MAISTSKFCPHCGDNHKGKPFAVYENGYHCFSCGVSKHSVRNFMTRKLEVADGLELPEHTRNPSMFDITILKWLRQSHITDDLIYKFNICQAEDGSVITPVVENNVVTMYQRRWFNPRRIMTYGKKQPFIAKSANSSDVLVLVEDFLSCVRVSETADCYCMFGTAVPYDKLVDLIEQYAIIIIWADGDKPGQNAAQKIHKALGKIIASYTLRRSFDLSTKKQVYNVCTDSDPKCYTNTEIRSILANKMSQSEVRK